MTQTSSEIEAIGTEVVPVEPEQSVNLFHTTDPGEVLKRATKAANELMPVVEAQNLVVKIQGRDHLTVEAWLTLGAMVGVTPFVEWTRQVDGGWEARVIVQTLDGRAIGAAEAQCLKEEGHWSKAEDYAIRSMAQTRATSKALASVLRFVATLGGASGTPAEEMDGVRQSGGSGVASEKQRRWLFQGKGSLIAKAGLKDIQAQIEKWGQNEDGQFKGDAARFLIDNLKEGTPEGIQAVRDNVAPASDVPADADGLDEPTHDGDDPSVPF